MSEGQTSMDASRYNKDSLGLKNKWLRDIAKYRLLSMDSYALLVYFYEESSKFNKPIICSYNDIAKDLNFVSTSSTKGEYLNREKTRRALKPLIDLQLVIVAKTGRKSVYILLCIDIVDLMSRIESLHKGSFKDDKVPTSYVLTMHHSFLNMGSLSYPQIDFESVEKLRNAMSPEVSKSLTSEVSKSLSTQVESLLTSEVSECGAEEARKPHEQGHNATSITLSIKNSISLSQIDAYLDEKIYSDAKRRSIENEFKFLIKAFGKNEVLAAFDSATASPTQGCSHPQAIAKYVRQGLEASKKSHEKKMLLETRSKLLREFKGTLTKAMGRKLLKRPKFSPEIESFMKFTDFNIDGEWVGLNHSVNPSSIDTVSNYFNRKMAQSQEYFIAKEAK